MFRESFRVRRPAFVPQSRDYGVSRGYSESLDSFTRAHFGLSALPIYVVRVPATPFASGRLGK
jgi:hypothetical protein